MNASPATSFGVRNENSSNFGSSTRVSGGDIDPTRVGSSTCTMSRNMAFSSQSMLVTCAGPRLTS